MCRRVVWRRSCTSPLSAGFYRKFDLWLLSVDLLTYDKFHRPPVVVAVGDYTFHVHENVLGANSILLHDALNSRSEGSTEQVVLPNLARCGLLFGKYIDWLYSGRLCLEPSIKWKPCYRIAEELQDCTFKDALIDIYIEKIVAEDDYPLLGHVIYQHTDRESPHRKLALDVAINFWHDKTLQDFCRYMPVVERTQEYFLDLIAAFAVKNRARPTEHVSPREFFKDIGTCIYHEHTNVKVPYSITPCYKTKWKV